MYIIHKTFLESINRIIGSVIQESKLEENVEISTNIAKILNDFSIDIPESIPKIDKIEFSDIDNTQFKINDKTYMSLAKVINKIQPNINNEDLKKIINKLKQEYIKLNKDKFSNFYFKIYKDIKKWYSICDKNFLSCMSTRGDLIEFYDNIDDISILVLFDKNHDVPIGRALLWKNIDGAKEFFMDRVYPANDINIINLYQAHAEENNWTYRDNEHSTKIYNGSNVLTYHIDKDINHIELLPFIDTFKYISLENQIMTNSFKNKQLGVGYLIADKTEGTYTNKYKPILDFLYHKNNNIKTFQELKENSYSKLMKPILQLNIILMNHFY